MRRITRPVLIVTVLALVAAACTGGETADTTQATIRSAVEAESSSTTSSSTTTSSTTTTTTLPVGPPIAAEGDNNETVEAAQFLLVCNGFGELTIDGAYGPATKTAVEAAQTAQNRTVNGILDEGTFAQLSRECSLSRRFPEDGEEVLTVVGNAAADDPEIFLVALLENSELSINVTEGTGVTVKVFGSDNEELPVEGQGTWIAPETGDYRVEVVVEGAGGTDETGTTEEGTGAPPFDPGVLFSLAVNLTIGEATTGEWIIATDGFSHGASEFNLGDDAQTVIDGVIDILGHGIRGAYEEFDTDWYTIDDPQSLGLRGVFIEGFAMLFFGPHPGEPDRPETFERLRFEGPSDDAEGEPRPEDYATTAEGITVGDTLADLKVAYGDDVSAGSNDEEHYYRYTDSGGELCFYFGGSAPDDTDQILEIATECRT